MKWQKHMTPLLFILLSPLAWSLSERTPPLLVLPVGERIQVPINGEDQIWVSNGSIIKLKDLHSRLQITTKKIGRTNIKIGKTMKTIFVLSKKNYKAYKKLIKITSALKGLELTINSRFQLVLKGKLLRLEDWILVAQVSTNEKTFKFLATISSSLNKKINLHFKNLFLRNHLPPLEFNTSPTPYFNLPPSLKNLKKHYQQIITPYGLSTIIAPHLLDEKPMIRVKITVAEIKRSEMLKLGLQWSELYSTELLSSKIGETHPSIFLKALEERGHSRILASPTLVCQSGKSASFLAGGEIPIQIIQHDKQHVVWKKYGISLKVSPKADLSGRISMAIETGISSIDMAQSIQGIPSLHTNQIKSHFNLSKTQTIVLSGLIQHNQGKAAEGLPFLSRLPIIGSLFSSRDFLNNKSELIILVSPEIIFPFKNESVQKKQSLLKEQHEQHEVHLEKSIHSLQEIDPVIKKFLSSPISY